MSAVKIAAIDLGTVSSRLLCAEMSNGQITASTKRTVITDPVSYTHLTLPTILRV